METSYEPTPTTALPLIDGEVSQLLREVLAPELDPFDPEEANAIMEEAQKGNAAAQYILGVALESLEPPRLRDACRWYRLAADQGYSPAKAKLRPHRVQ